MIITLIENSLFAAFLNVLHIMNFQQPGFECCESNIKEEGES